MALPTVVSTRAASGSGAGAIDLVGPDLHATLISAGWTIEYADADAIGSGSAGSPAWDKAFSSGVSAGSVVYRMPSNGYATRWYAKLAFGWGTSASRIALTEFTVGDTHDGSGAVTGNGHTYTFSPGTVNTGNLGYMVTASEDGFALMWDGTSTTGVLALAERARDANGDATDDLFVNVKPQASSWYRGVCSATNGWNDTLDVVYLARITDGAGTLSAVASLGDADGMNTSPIVGPYPQGPAMLAAPPRHAVILAANDAGANALVTLDVDAQAATYYTTSTATMHPAGYIAMAVD